MNVAPRRWKPGDKFSASHLNEAVDLAAAAGAVIGGDVEVYQGTRGRGIGKKRKPEVPIIFPIQIIEALVPIGQYKARTPIVYAKRIISEEDLDEQHYGEWPLAVDYNVVLWNINDVNAGSHTLSPNDYGMALSSGVRDGRIVAQFLGGSASLPTPQYQYMLGQGVANNVFGFDYFRGAPL